MITSEKLQHGTYNNDDVSLKELILKIRSWWRYLLSKWIYILGFGLLGGALGLSYSYLKKPVYVAVTTFVLEDEKASGGGLSSLAGLASMAGVDLGSGGGGIFQGDNILELYKSRKMIEQTLFSTHSLDGNNQTLIDFYIKFSGLRSTWKDNPKLQSLKFSQRYLNNRLQDSVINVIVNGINKNNLTVTKPDKKLSIIKVQVKSINEEFSKAFNEGIVKNVNDFYFKTKTKKSFDNLSILQKKTDSVRAVMNGAIYTAAAVADATPNLNPTRQSQRVAPVQRSQFSAETNKAILSSLVQNLEMAKISYTKEAPLIQIVDSPIFPLEINRVGKSVGIAIGGLLFGFISVLFLTLKKIFINILK